MPSEPLTVLAIDPGTSKCGIAVVKNRDRHDCPAPYEVLHRCVVPTDELTKTVERLAKEHSPAIILIGNGTSAQSAANSIKALSSIKIELVDEKLTSVAARKRYFQENPPRGLRRLLPTSLQTPTQPYDDYVAIILAERYLGTTNHA